MAARRRLSTILLPLTLLGGGLLALAIANLVTGAGLGTPLGKRLGVALQAAVVALDLALYAAARSRRLGDARVLELALIWELAVAVVVSVLAPWIVWEEQHVIPRVTWTSLIIASVPLIISSSPRRTLIVSALAAATVPAGLGALASAGAIEISAGELAGALVSPVFAAVAACLGSRVLFVATPRAGRPEAAARAREIGAYQLEERLAAGGMAEVWRGRHRLLARPAAIKLIRTDPRGAPSAEAVARFEREAQVTSTLRSPHTVELYDFGVADDGALYLVMELLDGIDLDALVRRFGPQPAARVVPLLVQACDSLGEAHDAGLIHRDIKPANLFLSRRGRQLDLLKVLDFGLVALDRGGGQVTVDGKLTGTPAYLAPEMARSPERVDRRADLYGLGCVAYWLLAGKPVFPGDSPLALIANHMETPPPPLLGVPAPLADVVMACLAKDPADRPASADALAAALGAIAVDDAWDRDAIAAWWDRLEPAAPGAAADPPTATMTLVPRL